MRDRWRLFRIILGAIAGGLGGLAISLALQYDYRTAIVLLGIDVFVLMGLAVS